MTYEAGLLKQESTTLRQPVSTEQTRMCSVPNKGLSSLIFAKFQKQYRYTMQLLQSLILIEIDSQHLTIHAQTIENMIWS